jgi:putative colanic acid biosynthesis glycosyltransferase
MTSKRTAADLMPGGAENLPVVSVVTVNRNTRDSLTATIESVLSQTYAPLEFIIIDGASSDGSVEIMRQFAADISYSISEPDEGIYDAMNKGVRAATGEWIIFMNSGDLFHDHHAVADVFTQPHPDADLVYGNSLCRYQREQVDRLIPAEPTTVLPLRMNCSHQSLFARRDLLLQAPFSLNLMAADYEFLLRMYAQCRRFKHIDRVVGININEGISDVKRLRSLKQRAALATKHGLMTPTRALLYICMAVQAAVGRKIRRTLPKNMASWLLRAIKANRNTSSRSHFPLE